MKANDVVKVKSTGEVGILDGICNWKPPRPNEWNVKFGLNYRWIPEPDLEIVGDLQACLTDIALVTGANRDHLAQFLKFMQEQEPPLPGSPKSIVASAEEVMAKAIDLDADVDSLGRSIDRYVKEAEACKKMKDEVTEALRECLSHYCPTCGFGDEGCGVIHHISCPMFLLLERAEGRKLKLNQDPEED